MEQVFIGLGANLNEPEQQIIDALSALSRLPESRLIKYSSLYASKPLGPKEQPDYVNAVAKLETGLAPLALLRQLQDIEQNHGRVRKAERWGARTLDLDIILFGQLKVLSEELTIPHYHFHHREFVLYPLSELEPELVITDMSDVPSLLKKVPLNGLTVIRSAKDLKIPE